MNIIGDVLVFWIFWIGM